MADLEFAGATQSSFEARRSELMRRHEELIGQPNSARWSSGGVYERWDHPVVTRDHVPLQWRYDFDATSNPNLLERLPVNAAFNAGAIYLNGRHRLVVRLEGADRKSFFGVAESQSGVDGFRFVGGPIQIPQLADPDVNVYDMRLTAHEDGWIYGLFCTERKDTSHPNDQSAAIAQCGIVRSQDMAIWERLPDLQTDHAQQRNVVLHPEFVEGRYALYTRPQDGFITVGSGGGIGFGLVDDLTRPVITNERLIEGKRYHTINESKNGQGPAPIKSSIGWLHLAHGVRNTAAGLRYVLYMFVTDLTEPWKVTHRPGGHFIAPHGEERVGDVSNVTFSNGWTIDENGKVFIYYASSDTRLHVATTDLERLIDYCVNTPEDPLFSHLCVDQRWELIHSNSRLEQYSWQ